MEGALAWISNIVEWIGQFIPQRRLIASTHAGVKWRNSLRGGRQAVIKLSPGMHWFWPFTTDLTTYPTARQTIKLNHVTISTVDDKTVAVGALFVYEISDIEAILAKTYDPEDTIHDIAVGALSRVVCNSSWPELTQMRRSGALDKAIKVKVRKDLERYGVRVLRTVVTDLAAIRVYKVIDEKAAQRD
jgi:regulator of protease activity HflC (stomatin/prohibitin superfamily)